MGKAGRPVEGVASSCPEEMEEAASAAMEPALEGVEEQGSVLAVGVEEASDPEVPLG